MKTAQEKLDWIKARLAEGRTVYLSTYTRATVIKARHLPQIRARDGNLEVQHGRRWLNHNFSGITAR